MPGAVTFVSMPRSKPKTSAEGKEQLSSSLARMASAPGGRGVPITEVGFGQCRFVIDDRSFPAVCCGEPTLGGSWCAQHRALVFVRVAVQANGRRPVQEPVKEVSAPPVAQPQAAPAVAVLASPAQAKAAKVLAAAKSPAGGQQKPETNVAPRKEQVAKDVTPGAAASATRSADAGRSNRDKKSAKVKPDEARKSSPAPTRVSRSGVGTIKSRAPERSGAAKKAAKPAKKGAVKRPSAANKRALSKSKKSPAKRSAAGKKSAPPHKRAAVKRSAAKAAKRKRRA